MDKKEKKLLAAQIEEKFADVFEGVSDYIFRHPELGGDEYESSNYLAELMRSYAFDVSIPYGNEKTAFRAEKKNGSGPVVALLAEYDALPGYGDNGAAAHACGHNWIAAVTAGTAITIGSMVENLQGTIVLMGTPAEETYGAKIKMIEEGCFDDVDIVLQAHLEERTDIMAPALAMDSLKFKFSGKAAHAAQFPHDGVNALDAVHLTFDGINAMRQQVTPDIRIHGIITDGGQAVNIIPERAECAFYVRGKKRANVDAVTQRVINCARGAELMTGAKLEITRPDPSFDDIITIPVLGKLAENNMKENGFSQVYREWDPAPGSTDIGNVSYHVPTLYAEIALDDGLLFKVHDREALKYANSETAYRKMHQMIRSFAGMAIDIFDDSDIVETAKKQLEEQK
ncbi:MAG: M20 family metallopeptidase [Clostridiales Family XIII bacterium]|nr:M20 family metallopeptidase [Clostridia bacterium]MDY3012364.1 M20 family metallopeptidase [Clostridiales Family XIII bacterium]